MFLLFLGLGGTETSTPFGFVKLVFRQPFVGGVFIGGLDSV